MGMIAACDWKTYWRLMGFTRPYMGRLGLGILCGLVYAAANGGFLWAINTGIAKVFDPARSPIGQAFLFALLAPLAGAMRGLSDFGSRYLIRWVGSRVVMDLRNAMFAKLGALPLSHFVTSRTGELISRTTNDTLMAENSVSTVVEDLAKEPVTLVVMVGVLLWIDPWLGFASLVLFPVCLVPIVLFGQRVRRFSKDAQQRIADLVSCLQEMITGVRIVKAFGMEDYELSRFKKQNHAFFDRIMRVARANVAIEPLIVFISTIGISLLLLYVRYREMTINQFVTYAGALVMMYGPVKKLSRIHLQIQQAVAAADRIFEVLDAEITVKDLPGALDIKGPVESLSFDRVSFAYETQPVLQDVSLQVRAGQKIAFVGSSGAGKSTLVGLLPRFYDVTSGAILLNGRDIRSYTLKSLRRTFGIVTQDTILFNDTVASNISYGTRDVPRDMVELAARQANADGFIRDMPDGYDTMIGERGVRLSGGQRQRLAIARAILRDPAILILDEATSALDTESERLVQAALKVLMQGRTVFAIAHRISTVADCDRIVVLEAGRIVEEGSHADLLELGGVYKRLYDLQFLQP